MPENTTNLTPLMKQYFEIKSKFPDCLLLFQVGDFYELFFDDAKKAAAILSIALTKRGNLNGEPIPLCGVPLHVLDHHLAKLVKSGLKVAICNQLDEAVPGKVVRRGVVQVLTPGTLTDSKLLNPKSASYLLSFFPGINSWAIVFGEILTAQLFATVIPAQAFKILESELARFFPDEILLSNDKQSKTLESYFKQLGYYVTVQQNNATDINDVLKNFNNDEIILKNEALLNSLYNFISYVKKNQESSFDQFTKINYYKPDDFLMLDCATQKNLDLIKNSVDGSSKNTLFELLDKATTSMGSRMIKKWVVRPLVNLKSIKQRQDAIEFLKKNIVLRKNLINHLEEISDLERTVGRVALKKAQLNDYLHLINALKNIPALKNYLIESNIELLESIESKIINFEDLYKLLKNSLNDDLNKNWIIKTGFNEQLDKLRELVENSNQKILQLEQQEQLVTGISSLKIRYNNIYGYYIEITKTNLDSVPQHYVRQQTLSGKERYVTPELQSLQHEIETARNQINQFEQNIFENIKLEVLKYLSNLRHTANALSNLDALIGLANVAYENGYTRPMFNEKQEIIIEDGKHPIISQIVQNQFIPNQTELTNQQSLWIITGPNMGGKSTYLRQVALLCIMAQCGSFIPAKSASLPILDRIFTRIGAGDNLAEGKSTFLVEMEETANICTQATQKSLVILDEVGRGTSTFDGLAIAQAVVEYIYTNVKAKCLFATHYHELTNLQHQFNGVASFYMASKKTENGIVFLHKIIKGSADSSFGIEVAKLANLPPQLISRAEQLLIQLNSKQQNNFVPSQKIYKEQNVNFHKQINEIDKLKNKISTINFDELTPRNAFDILWGIKDSFKQE